MTELLIKLFIRRPNDVDSLATRKAYGFLAAIVGITANVLLCASKFIVGAYSGSIAIQADAFNNLSDIATSAVALIGFKLSSRPADTEHPFGHARMEYISAMVIAFLILLIGYELGKESFSKILSPSPVAYSPVMLIVLGLSIVIKLWMGVFSRKLSRKIRSNTIAATMVDSLCDVLATGSIIVSILIGRFFGINIDGYIGLVVSGLILYAGVGVLRKASSTLMGEAPDPALVRELHQRLCAYDGINGAHDIVIHSYGPGRTLATAHAEVAPDADILEIHEMIDKAEREIGDSLNLTLTIHLDPLPIDDARSNEASALVSSVITRIDSRLSFHDFRVLIHEEKTNLMFDLAVPFGLSHERINQIKSQIKKEMNAIDPHCQCVITVDPGYTDLPPEEKEL
ncbi:MAG: cation diffusion facilitator family transporter [Bacillota bacterium]